MKKRIETINIKSKTANFPDTLQTTPSVRSAKKITSSKGLLTGFRNLTIDRAPIIPRDRAISFFITVVIISAMLGSNM